VTGDTVLTGLALTGIGAPSLLLPVTGTATLLGRPLPEAITGFLTRLSFAVSLLSFVAIAVVLLARGDQRAFLSLGHWFGAGDYHFALALQLDALSLPFAGLTAVLCGVVAAFAHRYLHREPGFHRFFELLSLFATGMQLIALGGTIEVIFAGWEFVGISSALLVAFFHERPAPVESGLRTFAIYRVSDAAFLAAAVLVHHFHQGGAEPLLSTEWPGGSLGLSAAEANLVGGFLLLAAIGKCAQLPVSGWLPRAMEGPTPSSAIFYGALSVHAGAYLLLRAAPLLDRAPLASALLCGVGACTALYAALVGRVQSDIKAALSFASLTQVSIVLVEIGLGLRWLPLLHIIAHSCLRSLQFLRAPSLLHDFHRTPRAAAHLASTGLRPETGLSPARRRWLYRLALHRGHTDDWLDALVTRPFVRLFRRLDRLERRFCRLVAGGDAAAHPPASGARDGD
jgi:NAD(P)H-quinone oxidoreductase subunit 5